MTLAQRPTTPPVDEPVTLAEVKKQLRIDTTVEDSLHESWITIAREYCEMRTGRQFIDATWKEYFDGFSSEMRLARPPLSSITSITYVDDAGDTQTLDSSVYQFDTISEPGRIKLADQQSWPSTRADYNAVIVTFVAGYGTAASDVPPGYRHAILMLVAYWNEFREAAIEGREIKSVPMAVDTLLESNRIQRF